MNIVNIKIVDPTYRELARALKDLRFINKSTADIFRYVHEKTDTVITLPMKADHEIVERASYAAMTYIMEWKGLIKNRDALGQIIEKNRLIEQGTAA